MKKPEKKPINISFKTILIYKIWTFNVIQFEYFLRIKKLLWYIVYLVVAAMCSTEWKLIQNKMCLHWKTDFFFNFHVTLLFITKKNVCILCYYKNVLSFWNRLIFNLSVPALNIIIHLCNLTVWASSLNKYGSHDIADKYC